MSCCKNLLKIIEDDRGTTTCFNDLTDIPFKVHRLLHIDNVPNGTTRGEHAHKNCTQLLACTKGKVTVTTTELSEDKTSLVEKTQTLTPPGATWTDTDFLVIPPLTWSKQTYEDDASLAVICSRKYDEDSYIRDYEDFKNQVGLLKPTEETAPDIQEDNSSDDEQSGPAEKSKWF